MHQFRSRKSTSPTRTKENDRLDKKIVARKPVYPICARAMYLFRSALRYKLEILNQKDLALLWQHEKGSPPSCFLCATEAEAKTVVPETSSLVGIHPGLTQLLVAREKEPQKMTEALPQDLQDVLLNPNLLESFGSVDLSQLVNYYDADTFDKFLDNKM